MTKIIPTVAYFVSFFAGLVGTGGWFLFQQTMGIGIYPFNLLTSAATGVVIGYIFFKLWTNEEDSPN
jgi:hypothetical protein